MTGYFVYDFNRCVSCYACVAGCTLVNGPEIPWRRVLTDNPSGSPGLPVHNLSMACNHCEDPACLKACPARAYHIDPGSGAVLLSEEKCIGCNYCFWSCPFDAPRYNSNNHTVEKCNFCFERINKGAEPACTDACPTGALSFTAGKSDGKSYGMIPDSSLEPRITILPLRNKLSNRESEDSSHSETVKRKVDPFSEWSLVLFTFLSSLLFGFSFSAVNGGFHPGNLPVLLLTVFTVLIPLAHLGKPLRSWRAILNAGRSPLSNEIFFLLVFAILTTCANMLESPALRTLSFIAGLFLLVTIDSVYTVADRRTEIIFHPGQAFLVGLVMASLFSGESRALFFVISLQMVLNIWVRMFKIRNRFNSPTGIIIMFLIIAGMTGHFLGASTWFVYLVILSAQLLNRLGYYYDFDPPGLQIRFTK